jgi:hypothetical protein
MRLGLDLTRRCSPETNKDRRVGFMFKAPSAADYWRSQKASSTLKVSSKRRCGPKPRCLASDICGGAVV